MSGRDGDSSSDELSALPEEERGVAARLRALDVRAPERLVARVEAALEPPRRRSPRLPIFAGGLATAVAVALALVLLVGSNETSTRPAVGQAADLARGGPSSPAPKLGTGWRLATSIDGLHFPNYAPKFGWRAVGARADRLNGRATRTVFYRQGGHPLIAYTIVSGAKLDWPAGWRRAVRDGVPLRWNRAGGDTTVAWLRKGHTCVLSGSGVRTAELLDLAGWNGRSTT